MYLVRPPNTPQSKGLEPEAPRCQHSRAVFPLPASALGVRAGNGHYYVGIHCEPGSAACFKCSVSFYPHNHPLEHRDAHPHPHSVQGETEA